jgi:hypothetical protein
MTNKEKTLQAWKQITAEKKNTASLHLMMLFIKTVRAKSNDKAAVMQGLINKTFTPITNTNRLQNGAQADGSLRGALVIIRWRLKNMARIRDPQLYRSADTENFLKLWDTLTDEEQRAIMELSMNSFKLEKEKNYCVFFTREDLSPAQQVVQTAHTALCMGTRYKGNPYTQHMLMFGVPNLAALTARYNELQKLFGKDIYAFIEPDIGNEMTSFGINSVSVRAVQKIFAKDQLLQPISDEGRIERLLLRELMNG